MKTPLVSIHLISYNQAAFIEESLESVIRQNYPNLQLVAADDGSTDGTAEIIERYARQYPGKVQALTGEPNMGITANCNRALKVCRGEFVAFLAGDDYYLPGKIKSQVDWFAKNTDAVLCGHQLDVLDQASGISRPLTRRFHEGRGPARWIEGGPLYGSLSIMVRSRAIPARGFDERVSMVSDNLFWIDCLSPDGRFGYLPDTFAVYRKHLNNFTNDKPGAIGELNAVFTLIEEAYPRFAPECRRGRANLIEYGLALNEMNRGSSRSALRRFAAAWVSNPRNLKIPLRMAQALGRCLLGQGRTTGS